MSRAKRKRRRKGVPKRTQLNFTASQLCDRKDFKGAINLLLKKEKLTDNDHRVLAKCYLHIEEYDQAVNELNNIENLSNEDFVNSGIYLLFAKKWDEAKNTLSTALSLDPKSSILRYWLARAIIKDNVYYAEEEEKSEARMLLQEACEIPNCIPHVFTELVALLDWDSNSDQILNLLWRGFEIHPHDEIIRYQLIQRLILNLNEYALAEEIIQPLLGDEEISPEYQWAYIQIQLGLNNWDGALHEIDKLISITNTPTHLNNVSGLYQLKGEVFLFMGNAQLAAECFRAELLLESSVDSVIPRFGLAICSLMENDLQASHKFLEQGLTNWSRDSYVLYLPGRCGYLTAFGFEFNFQTTTILRSKLECLVANEDFEKLILMFDYLIDRLQKTHIPLKELRPLSKALNIPLIKYDFSITFSKQGRFEEAIEKHLSFLIEYYKMNKRNPFNYLKPFYRRCGIPNHPEDQIKAHQMIVKFLNYDERHQEPSFTEETILPFYFDYWKRVLFEGKLWKQAIEVALYLKEKCKSNVNLFFDYAYCLSNNLQNEEAISAYRELLDQWPNDAVALYNLSLLIEEIDCVEAYDLAKRAFELDSDDDYFKRRWEAVQNLENRFLEKEEIRVAEATRLDDFYKTARERFPQLDFYKRRILSTLTIINSFDSFQYLAELSGTGQLYIEGNWRKLVELGMVIEDENGSYRINEYIVDLVQQERSHSVVTKLIRADNRIAFKPIFNSKLEYKIYNVMIGLFPNHLVFPNMSLQTIFQYSRIKELVDADTFKYYLMSQTDICITSTSSYLPQIAFEIDSHYHDDEDQIKRDLKKDKIFRVGGVPLLRIRAHGQPSDAVIRNEIIKNVRELGTVLSETQLKSHGMLKLDIEIDFESFGMGNRNEDQHF